jgi:hypothetical protein
MALPKKSLRLSKMENEKKQLKLKLNTIKIVSLEPKDAPMCAGATTGTCNRATMDCTTCVCGGNLGIVADY